MATRAFEIPIANFTTLGRMTFTTGANGSVGSGDVIEQGDAAAYVTHTEVTSGSWDDGDAAGFIYCQLLTRPANSFSTGAATKAGGTATFTITEAQNSGIVDGRFKDAPIVASFEYTPSESHTGDDLFLGNPSLVLAYVEPNHPTNIGIPVDNSSGDTLQIPMRVTHGPRSHAREAGFCAYGLWDDSAGKLIGFVQLQGIIGKGAGASSSLPAAVMSCDGNGNTVGDMIDLSLSNAKFMFTFSTDDVADPPSGGGGSISIRAASATQTAVNPTVIPI